MTKPGPLPDDSDSGEGREKPYVFDDVDRARSAQSRRQQTVERALTCDACRAEYACLSAKPGCICALEPLFKRFPSRDVQACITKIQELISLLEARTWRAYYFEQLRGGKALWRVSALFRKLIKYHYLLASLFLEVGLGGGMTALPASSSLKRLRYRRRMILE